MRRAQSGFTLIELLVVVAILAVLMALLLPSLSKAREQSKTVSCLTKFREIGTLTHMYIAENNDYQPFTTSVSSTRTYLSNTFGVSVGQKMFSRNGLFCCPTLSSQYSGFGSPATTLFQTAGLSSRFNVKANSSPPDPITTFKRVLRPHEKIFLLDSTYRPNYNDFHWNQDPGAAELVAQPAHNNGYRNYLFFDFHVETIKASKVRSTTNVILYKYWDPYTE